MNQTDKPASNKQRISMPKGATVFGDAIEIDPRAPLRVSPETSTMTATELNAWTADRAFRRTEYFAEVIALAILRNPKVDQLLGRNPLDPGRAGDHANAGAALASASLRLADDYVQALDALLRTRAQALPPPLNATNTPSPVSPSSPTPPPAGAAP